MFTKNNGLLPMRARGLLAVAVAGGRSCEVHAEFDCAPDDRKRGVKALFAAGDQCCAQKKLAHFQSGSSKEPSLHAHRPSSLPRAPN